KAIDEPPPAPLKQTRGAGRAHVLPPPPALPRLTTVAASGTLQQALNERRTWRQFGPGALSAEQLSTLLGLTWGVQQWMHIEGFGRMPLKTSLSGGARHSIEAYAYVRRVSGLSRGWYHYDPDRHVLRPIPSARKSGRKISAYLPKQHWYDDAAVLIAM